MKIRTSFVSNSSSSSFIIINKSKEIKTELDFVKEVGPRIFAEFIKNYAWYKDSDYISLENMLLNANDKTCLGPEEESCWTYGDEDGTALGVVFDYGLRDGGESENFRWYMVDCRGSSYFSEED